MKNSAINEELLSSWLTLTNVISNEDFVTDMPFNEAIICHILYQNQISSQTFLTATDLCRQTKMLKSQMNRTLTAMEKKNIIIRRRAEDDKRNIYIELLQNETYIQQHQKILDIINLIIDKLGEKRIYEIIELFNEITVIAKEVLNNEIVNR